MGMRERERERGKPAFPRFLRLCFMMRGEVAIAGRWERENVAFFGYMDGWIDIQANKQASKQARRQKSDRNPETEQLQTPTKQKSDSSPFFW